MIKHVMWCALALVACAKDKAPSASAPAASTAPAATAPKATGSRVIEIAKTGDFDALVAAEAAKARADGLVPFLEFEADWCPPCKAIKKTMEEHDPQMADAFAGTAIIQADLDAWPKPAEQLGVDGIPAFLAVDAQGKVTKRKIDGGAWADNIPANMAPPLKAFFHAN